MQYAENRVSEPSEQMTHKYKFTLFFTLSLLTLESYAFDRDTMFICKNDCINYTSNTTIGTAVAWEWVFQGASQTGSNQQNPAGICYPTAGYFLTTIKTTFDTGKDTTDSIIIAVRDGFDHNFPWVNDTGYCIGANASITLNTTTADGLTYNWSNGSKSSSASFSSPGSYWVDLVIPSDFGPCDSLRKVVNITEHPAPNVYLGQDKYMCQGQVFPLDAGAGAGYTYLWQPNSEVTQTINVTLPGLYSVTVTNNFGCQATDEIEFLDSCPHYIFIPNAVSPNADRLNDLFVKVWNFTPREYKFTIYNRWGEMLWETTDMNAGWDCTSNGQPVQQDIYCYKLVYLDTDKKWYEHRGTFYVVR